MVKVEEAMEPFISYEQSNHGEAVLTAREVAKAHHPHPNLDMVVAYSRVIHLLLDTDRMEKRGRSERNGKKQLYALTDNGRQFYEYKYGENGR